MLYCEISLQIVELSLIAISFVRRVILACVYFDGHSVHIYIHLHLDPMKGIQLGKENIFTKNVDFTGVLGSIF
ncbi:hypothetical protein SRRS_51720 [Sporomusa rhizae]